MRADTISYNYYIIEIILALCMHPHALLSITNVKG